MTQPPPPEGGPKRRRARGAELGRGRLLAHQTLPVAAVAQGLALGARVAAAARAGVAVPEDFRNLRSGFG